MSERQEAKGMKDYLALGHRQGIGGQYTIRTNVPTETVSIPNAKHAKAEGGDGQGITQTTKRTYIKERSLSELEQPYLGGRTLGLSRKSSSDCPAAFLMP
jgi:hypothetical protein